MFQNQGRRRRGYAEYPPPLAGPGGYPLHFFSWNTVMFSWESYNSLCLLKIFVTGTQQRKKDFLLATDDFAIWRLLLAVNVYCQVSIYVNFNYIISSIVKVIKNYKGCLYFLIVSIAFSLLSLG